MRANYSVLLFAPRPLWIGCPRLSARRADGLGGRPRPSVELPITRRGRAVCDVSHVWHTPRACHGHSHERPRHARIPPLVSGVVLGLSVNVLGPRWIMLERWDRPNARSASAEAIDHRPTILADKA